MFLGDKNDRPLVAVVAAIAAITLMAWSHTPAAIDQSAEASRATPHAASLPADYTAPPISGTTATPIPKDKGVVDIVRDPSDLPPPIGARGPRRITVNLHTIEVTGQLADGTTYRYWTFNGKVPGPFVRVRVGDEVTVNLSNDAADAMMHNIDLHAVLGPGGGAGATLAGPGETKSFTFKAVHPGLFVYHCATQPVAQHIANGMFGMILVEPVGGLPKVDREYYMMQNEIYTDKPFGTAGLLDSSYAKLLAETPEYFVFNGAVGALTDKYPLKSMVGETVRIFFGNAGPNKTSSFHVIGQVFDSAYDFGSLTAPPLTDVQTITVPPGGAAAVSFKTLVPGKYMFVDHAIARVERGLVGALVVQGPPNPDLFHVNQQRAAMVTSH